MRWLNDCLVFTSRLGRKHSYGDHCLEIMAPKFTLMLCAYGFWAEMIFTVQWYKLLHGRLRLLTGSNPYSNLCLFVCSYRSHSRIFHSYGDVTVIDQKLQILTYFRHSGPLSSELFSVSHLQWHRSTVYNGHLRGPMTLVPVAERLTVKLSRPD